MLAQADDSVVPKLKEALERRTERKILAVSHAVSSMPHPCSHTSICRSAGEVEPSAQALSLTVRRLHDIHDNIIQTLKERLGKISVGAREYFADSGMWTGGVLLPSEEGWWSKRPRSGPGI